MNSSISFNKIAAFLKKYVWYTFTYSGLDRKFLNFN